MYYNQIIETPLTLINKSNLLGSLSDAEEVIAGGIQTLKNQKYFAIEFSIEDVKDSPRIDFIIMFDDGERCAIEVNGYQHFVLNGFKQGSKEYRNQWVRYFKKVKWCQDRGIPMIHLNILFDTRTCTKIFRKQLNLLITNGTFQKAIDSAIQNQCDVAINMTKSGLLHLDTVRYESGLPDLNLNEAIKRIVLGQGTLYKQNCITINV